jgi:hypothetical protein
MVAFACGGDDGESRSSADALYARPETLLIESQSGRIEVGASAFETPMIVADGTMPPSGPPLVEGATVQLEYEPGWTFTADARNDEGGQRVRLEVTAIDEHRFTVAAPPPGSYEIFVHGNSSGGDLVGAMFVFRWMVTP